MVKKAHLSVVETVPNQYTNAEIVAGLVARESFAALALHAKFGSQINRLVWRMLGADAEHNDVVNDVFLNVLKEIGKLRSPDALEKWIVSIALNTVRKEIRSRRRRYSWGFKEIPEKQYTKENQEDVRKAKTVISVLDQMKVEHRIVLVLRFIEQYTLPEIAEATGRSLSTVNRQLAGGKRQFRKLASKDVILKNLIDGETNE